MNGTDDSYGSTRTTRTAVQLMPIPAVIRTFATHVHAMLTCAFSMTLIATQVRDLYAEKDLGVFQDEFSHVVDIWDVAMLRMSNVNVL